MATGQLNSILQNLRRASFFQDRAGQTDDELLECFLRQRDEAAFAAIVRRHGPMVLGVCRRVLQNEADAEDAFQGTFLVLVRKAATIAPAGRVGNWLFGVAYNIARKARAATVRRRAIEFRVGVIPRVEPPDEAGPPWQALLDRELHGLPAKYRVPIVLCDLEGRTRKEAARQLRWAEGTVASRLARARILLARRLAHHGLALSSGAVAALLSQGTTAASVPAILGSSTVKAAAGFAAGSAATVGKISARVAALTEGMLQTMFLTKLKITLALMLAACLLLTGALLLGLPILDATSNPAQAKQTDSPLPPPDPQEQPAPKEGDKAKWRSCIILWMNGGPSQIDTFDPKPGHPNGGKFGVIDTAIKGVQISEHLPQIAKLMNHMVLIRSLTHNDGDHNRGTYLMRTGHPHDGLTDYPAFACMLAKVMGDGRPDLPRYFSLLGAPNPGPGLLGKQFGPLAIGPTGFGGVGGGGGGGGGIGAAPEAVFPLPPVAAFEELAKGKGAKHRKAVEKAFDLKEEKPAVQDAYGKNSFGQGCLLARRLVEVGVPVVEVNLGGWDTHGNNLEAVKKLSKKLDPAWASLLTDLKERKLLDSTLIVWMGEFGRTPVINAAFGRDHYPKCFSVVLAGGGIKGGQVIGKTSKDGFTIEERPVTPPELLATIYQALGIDHNQQVLSPTGLPLRYVDKGTKAVQEALP